MDRTESLLTAPAAGSPAAPEPPSPAGPATAGPDPGRRQGDRPPPADPRWTRPALVALLLATGLLYLWGLGASGWANSFYSAAVQAGAESWQAFFYGSSDAANSITVDKTPAALWLMALSVRIFGLNSWSILVPQALLGVASVGVLFATVRRWHGAVAGLLAGAVLATTPVATLMFRFNNPDALLVLLLVAAAYATVRAVETASTRWLALVGVLVGLGFLTKMLQAFLVIPVFAGVYLLAAPTGGWRRVRQLLLSGLALLVTAGWWVAIVELVPSGARPWIGGSQHDSILELTLGYNGLSRLTGDEVGSVGRGPMGGGGPFSGQTGWLRMFDTEVGGQVSWLLPAALILLVAGLVLVGRAPRTDRRRAGLLLWGGWLLVTGLIFSLMSGIFHAYYTVALAPAVGALVGIGVTLLWRERAAWAPPVDPGQAPRAAVAGPRGPVHVAPAAAGWRARAATVVLALTLVGTAWWSWRLLVRSADWQPWLRTAVIVVGLAAAVLVVLADRLPRRVVPVVLALGVAATLAGPVAYSVQTAGTPHTGAIPTAGPFVQGASGPGRGGFPAGRPPGGQFPGFPAGDRQDGRGTRGGGLGGLLDAREPSAEMTALLMADADAYTWVAATIGSNNASGYQLATGRPVLAVGGFNGSDPSPTLARFQRYVAAGKIHYFLGGGGFRADGGSSASREIAAWVAEHHTAKTVDGVTVYDLTTGK